MDGHKEEAGDSGLDLGPSSALEETDKVEIRQAPFPQRTMSGEDLSSNATGHDGNVSRPLYVTRSMPSLVHLGTRSSGLPCTNLPRTTSWQFVLQRVTSLDGPGKEEVNSEPLAEPSARPEDLSPGRETEGHPRELIEPSSNERMEDHAGQFETQSPRRGTENHPREFVNTGYEPDEYHGATFDPDHQARDWQETIGNSGDVWKRQPRDLEMHDLSPSQNDDVDNGNAPELVTAFRPANRYVVGVAPPSYRQAMGITTEEGDTDREDVEKGRCATCGDCGPLQAVCSTCRDHLPKGVYAKVVLLVIIITCVAVLLGTFCSSFVYVEYYQVALLRTKSTGVVEEDTVYPGCYVLGPDKEFQLFYSSLYHLKFDNVGVYSGDGMPVEISCDVFIKLRPKEIGQLYKKFKWDFLEVFKPIINSTIKNTVPLYKVDDFRFKRDEIQRDIQYQLSLKLGGDCCPDCCESPDFPCNKRAICWHCQQQPNCSRAYHADVPYFSLRALTLNDQMMGRYLTRLQLQVQAETEQFIQDRNVTLKKIDLEVQAVLNQANKILANATAEAVKIRAFAEAEREVVTQTEEMNALNSMCGKLNITQVDHKMSLYMIHTLEHLPHLYRAEDYSKASLFKPSP